MSEEPIVGSSWVAFNGKRWVVTEMKRPNEYMCVAGRGTLTMYADAATIRSWRDKYRADMALTFPGGFVNVDWEKVEAISKTEAAQ